MSEIVPPPLREELKVGKLVQMGELSYVIKEPDKQAFYHFDDAQYQLMVLFDGIRDLARVVEVFNQRSDVYEYDLEAAEELYESCREFQLLTRTRAEQNTALLEKIKEERQKKLLQGQGSVLFLRFQLVDPNKLFDRIIDRIRFLWHPTAIRIQIGFLITALIAVLFQGERFFDDFSRVYFQAHEGGYGLLSIWLIALSAIAVHECGHGLTCKYYGGDVHEMGFLLLAFQPCLYCNVNDAWLFENKWHKIYVALAGVWVEMLLAGIGAFVWIMVDVGNPIGYVAFVLLTIGTATSLVVNLNPLLKFDGYYILTDVLEIQNLRQNSIAWASYLLKTRIFRMDEEAPFTPSRREKRIYLIYGGLVILYMAFILSFIAVLGYGLISAQFGFLANLGFIYLVYWLLKKITGSWGEFLLNWIKTLCWSSVRRQRVTLVSAIIFVSSLIFWQPHLRVHATGQVEAPTVKVYAGQSGFVTHVDYDQKRQLGFSPYLVSMSSIELEMAREDLKSKQNMLQMQRQEASAGFKSADHRRLLIESQLLQEQTAAVDEQHKKLLISKPPGDWIVDGIPSESLIGRYFSEGDEILTLVAQTQRYIDVVVDQRDMYLLSVGDEGRIRFAGVGPAIYDSVIESIAPVAKLDGIEQSFVVRMVINEKDKLKVPPLGLSGEILIFGKRQPLGLHFVHSIRKILRADLWL